MKNIWFTADTHFGHTNRPFSSIEEMDESLISNWNSNIKNGDIVYHLGDFSFKAPILYREKLNGDIILVRGNHDYKAKNESLFLSIHDLLFKKIDGISIVMCHFAMRTWHKSHFGSWQLYGHSHGALNKFDYEKNTYDVGVDNNNYTPLSFEQIKEIMNKKNVSPEFEERYD